MNKKINRILGVLIGLINITIGACGGIVAVATLKKNGLSQKSAQATAISIILPLSIISVLIYFYKGNINFNDTIIYIVPGILGSIIGADLLNKIPNHYLKKIFAVFMIYAGLRMWLK